MNTLKKFFYGSALIFGLLSLTACNTVAGFGQDMQQGGKAITKAADKSK